MSKEKRRVPKLRFPGFTEDWEQRKLGAMCSLFIDGDWIESKDQSNEGIRLIQTGNIGVGKFIDKPENKKWISHSTFNNLRCKELLDGDILISRLPQPAGRACIVNTNNEKWITAVDCTIVRLLDQYSNKFILQSLCTYNYFHLIDSFLAGGTRQRVSRSNLSDINIMSPKKIEQDKIGLFFEYVDNLITLHQRKLEHLNLKKKALLQKLFPKDGERYPELRFPGFTDAWEQRKLGEFTNQINTFVNPEDAKLPLWSLTAEAGLIEKTDRYERDFLVKKKDQFKRIENNTLVYNPMNITIGSIDIYTGLYPIAVSGYYVSIVYDKNIDTDFLKEVLLLPSSLKMYKNYATGSLIERQRVQYPTFSKLQLLFPNPDEQRAIGQLFKSLNLNITLHQRKLEDLQLQKKALLQQMFV